MNHIQQQNVQLLRMIAKIDKEGGKVSTRWDQFFIADWYEVNTDVSISLTFRFFSQQTAICSRHADTNSDLTITLAARGRGQPGHVPRLKRPVPRLCPG